MINGKLQEKGRIKAQDKEFYQKLGRLALPIAFQHLMLALVAAADAFMLGSVEQNAMSAVSLATQIQFIQNMILAAAVAGTSILGAQYYGKKDEHAIQEILAISFRICGVVSILYFLGCILFPRQLMLIFTNEEELIAIGVRYLRIAGWSYLLTGFSQCYLALMKVSGHADTSAKISCSAVILNILFNALLIFGLFGLPALGVQGAAIATLIARVIELVLSVLISEKEGYIQFQLKFLFLRNKLLAKDYYHCILPILGACLLWGVGFTSYSAFMGHLGVDAAGANSIVAVIRDLVCCLCEGLASGGGIMVGNELGAGKLERGKKYGDRLAKLSFVCGAISTIVMLAVLPFILMVVKLSPGAKQLLTGMMIVMAIYMIGRCVNSVIINGIFSAGGDTMFDMYSLAVTMWGLAVPLAALGTFVFHWPVWVVYACTCLDEVGKIPWVLVHYRKYKWVKDLTRDFS